MKAYLFPGQGSQIRGMGSELFSEFSNLCDQASHILGYCIKTLCLLDPEQKLNQTQFTQPALYTVNALTYFKKIQQGENIDFTAGHSLGEYNALLAANIFDFETGLRLVQKRGELMQQVSDGSMAAVIGLTSTQIEDCINTNNLNDVTIANYNSYQQNVISGSKAKLAQAQQLFSQFPKATIIPLNVRGAFHTFHMNKAGEQFADFLEPFSFGMPTLPVISNCNASIYHPAQIKQNLINHVSYPVQWVKTIEYLLTYKDITLEEVGPGKVLTGLTSRIVKQQ